MNNLVIFGLKIENWWAAQIFSKNPNSIFSKNCKKFWICNKNYELIFGLGSKNMKWNILKSIEKIWNEFGQFAKCWIDLKNSELDLQ